MLQAWLNRPAAHSIQSERTSSDYSGQNTSDLPPTTHVCPRGHRHHSADGAARCDAKYRTSRSSASSVSSVASTFTAESSSAPTRLEPLSEGNVMAFTASQYGNSGSHIRAPRSVATSISTSTTHTWQNLGSMAAVLPAAGGSRQPVHPNPLLLPAQSQAPSIALISPMPSPTAASVPATDSVLPYKPHIEDYDPDHRDWYVVVVGRRVGVFRTA